MQGLLILFAVLGGGFAAAFALLPTRLLKAVALAVLLLAGALWNMPHYYLIDLSGGLGAPATTGGYFVLNELPSGRSWTFYSPVNFSDVKNVGHFSAGLVVVCLLGGGLVGHKLRRKR